VAELPIAGVATASLRTAGEALLQAAETVALQAVAVRILHQREVQVAVKVLARGVVNGNKLVKQNLFSHLKNL